MLLLQDVCPATQMFPEHVYPLSHVVPLQHSSSSDPHSAELASQYPSVHV